MVEDALQVEQVGAIRGSCWAGDITRQVTSTYRAQMQTWANLLNLYRLADLSRTERRSNHYSLEECPPAHCSSAFLSSVAISTSPAAVG